jgi:hypothetical protein
MKLTLCLGLAALAGAGGPGRALRAAEGVGPAFRYGVQLLGAAPAQDFKNLDNRVGVGAGLFAENNLGSGVVIQSRLDYVSYSQYNQPAAGGIARYTIANPLTLSSDTLSVGVDLHKHLGLGEQDGWFVLAGASAIRFEFQTSGAVTQGANTVVARYKDKTPLTLGLDAGFGYAFNPAWSLALRYTTASLDGTTLATVETGLSYRF